MLIKTCLKMLVFNSTKIQLYNYLIKWPLVKLSPYSNSSNADIVILRSTILIHTKECSLLFFGQNWLPCFPTNGYPSLLLQCFHSWNRSWQQSWLPTARRQRLFRPPLPACFQMQWLSWADMRPFSTVRALCFHVDKGERERYHSLLSLSMEAIYVSWPVLFSRFCLPLQKP